MAFSPKLLQQGSAGGGPKNYIEDVFSTYLYTGNGSTQTITNGIDLSTKGGLVWLKGRTDPGDGAGIPNHIFFDTVRGDDLFLRSSSSAAQGSGFSSLFQFENNGFTLGNNHSINYGVNNTQYVSWTFREQPKFFDVVTFTSNGSNAQAISHSLGSVPGCIILKRTDSTQNWIVWHRGDGTTDRYSFSLNNTSGANSSGSSFVSSGYINSTSFQPNRLEDYLGSFPVSGGTYVAYLFAHDAGGFGLTGNDNVISCGTFDATSAGSVTLGYEPQWVLIKASDDVGSWHIQDNMRGYTTSGNNPTLDPDRSVAEFSGGYTNPTATGFIHGSLGSSFIYIAIRRGPMKVPTSGTSVFTPTLATFSGTTVTNTGFVVDMAITKSGVATTSNNFVLDRLRGSDNGANQKTIPSTSTTSAETASSGRVAFTGSVTIQNGFLQQETTANNIVWAFGRAPSFFDEVCYTGNSTASTPISHNLGVIPELIIVKSRSAVRNWPVYIGSQGNNGNSYLNLSNAWAGGSDVFANATPTASEFYVGNNQLTNNTAETYVAYLFATCAGVSKVGSYTGTGTTLQVNCGFTGGARFVLIKRTDSTGAWYVWDSARGIVAGDDPYLLLNSTAVEVTNTDYIDTYSPGFELSSTAPDAINNSGGTYIFLAIA